MSKVSNYININKPAVYMVLHITILVLSLILIVAISIDTFMNYRFMKNSQYLELQFWVCMFFIFDIVFEYSLSNNKRRYITTHFIFFVASIPYLNIINYFNIEFQPPIEYYLRFIPLLRGGYALAIVVGWLAYNKITSIFISYITMLISSVYFASLLFYIFESDVNPAVSTYGDSLWWAFMDITTVGCNIYAVTATGKVLSVVLAALGMMMFPIFTVYITSIVEKSPFITFVKKEDEG